MKTLIRYLRRKIEVVKIAGIMLAILVVVSWALISSDAFEAAYDFTRAHEEWELDELLIVALATVFAWIVGSALFLRRRGRQLSKTVAELRTTNAALVVAKIRGEAGERAKTEFLAAMSHELRTPLNAIIGFSQSMSAEVLGPLGDLRYRDYVRDIETSAEHLRDMIDEILNLAQADLFAAPNENGTMMPLGEVCAFAVRLVGGLAATHKVTVTTDIPEIDLHMPGDQRRITQAIVNVLSNAVKYSVPGSTVHVAVAQDDDGALVMLPTQRAYFSSQVRPELAPHAMPGAASRSAHWRVTVQTRADDGKPLISGPW